MQNLTSYGASGENVCGKNATLYHQQITIDILRSYMIVNLQSSDPSPGRR